MLFETKLIISYIAVCLTYTICRLHYLLAVKQDSELKQELGKLVDYAGDEGIIKCFIALQVLFCPVLAPMSVLKHTFNFFIKKNN